MSHTWSGQNGDYESQVAKKISVMLMLCPFPVQSSTIFTALFELSTNPTLKKKVPSDVFIGLGSLWYGFNIVVHLLTLFKIHVFAVEIILESTEKTHGVKYPASKGKCITCLVI